MTASPLPHAVARFSDKEMVLHEKGFDCFSVSHERSAFRQFFLVGDLRPIWRVRLQRLGADPEDQVSICYSEGDNVVSTCVLRRDIYLEFEANSLQGLSLLWAFGVEF